MAITIDCPWYLKSQLVVSRLYLCGGTTSTGRGVGMGFFNYFFLKKRTHYSYVIV